MGCVTKGERNWVIAMVQTFDISNLDLGFRNLVEKIENF